MDFSFESMDSLKIEYSKLADDISDIELAISTIDDKRRRLDLVKNEMNIRNEQLKKSAFEAVLSKFDTILELYPSHTVGVRTISALSEGQRIDVDIGTDPCSDSDPKNIITCERCAMIHLRKHINQEIANFIIM